jgi:endo-alpha-1,4-polygalactosaminidase (GH114 family)
VIVQNAEELLDQSKYRKAIDAVAKEDLVFGLNGTGVRNPQDEIVTARTALRRLQKDRKPLFAIEYLTDPAQMASARRDFSNDNIVAVFPTRGLDGRDPAAPANRQLSSQKGTPEYGAANCDGLIKRKS